MGAGHKHGGSPAGDADPRDAMFEKAFEYTLDLRIAAVFIIFATALLGAVAPLFIKRVHESAAASLVRAFSAGVILSLTLVHIFPHAAADLSGITTFPVGGACTVFGIILLMLIEHGLNGFLSGPPHLHHGHDHGHTPKHEHAHEHKAKHEAKEDIEVASEASEHREEEHGHACMAHDSTASWLKSAPVGSGTLRAQVFAYVMEIGCIFHSVLIGVGLGVIVDDRKEVITLLLALSFHQFLEGVSLGSVIAMAGFARAKGMLMVMLYSLTTPIGTAIGIGISSSYDPGSVTSLAVSGTLNGVAGGMLLYVALVQLIGEEFSRQDLNSRPKLKLGMLASAVVGATLMCVLAIWA